MSNFSPNLSLSSPESSFPTFSPQVGDRSASRRYLFMCRKKVRVLMVRNTTSRSERIKLIQTVKVLRAKNRDLTEQIKVLQAEVQSLNQAAVAAQKLRHSFSFTSPPVHVKLVVSGLVVTEIVGHAVGQPKLKPISIVCRKTKKVVSSCKRRIFRGKTQTVEEAHQDLQWIFPKGFSVSAEKTRKVIAEPERPVRSPLPMIYYPFT